MSNQDWVCAICLEDHSTDLCTLRPCGHVFHSQCMQLQLNSVGAFANKCPNCRSIFSYIDFKYYDQYQKNNFNIFKIEDEMDDYTYEDILYLNTSIIKHYEKNKLNDFIKDNIYLLSRNDVKNYIINSVYKLNIDNSIKHNVINKVHSI